MVRANTERSRRKTVGLVMANAVAFAPVVLYIWLVVMHGDESGSEILAIALAPFFLVTLTVLVADFVLAVRSLGRPDGGGLRRVAAIVVVVTLGGLFTYSGVAVAIGAWERHERNRPLSLSDAQAMVAHCEVRSISRDDGETHIFLRRYADDGYSRHADGQSFESLVRAVSKATPKCGPVSLVDVDAPITRQFVDAAEATHLVSTCALNGIYYGRNDARSPYEQFKEGPATGIVLRDARFYKQLIVTDPGAATIVIPAARQAQRRCTDLVIYLCSGPSRCDVDP